MRSNINANATFPNDVGQLVAKKAQLLFPESLVNPEEFQVDLNLAISSFAGALESPLGDITLTDTLNKMRLIASDQEKKIQISINQDNQYSTEDAFGLASASKFQFPSKGRCINSKRSFHQLISFTTPSKNKRLRQAILEQKENKPLQREQHFPLSKENQFKFQQFEQKSHPKIQIQQTNESHFLNRNLRFVGGKKENAQGFIQKQVFSQNQAAQKIWKSCSCCLETDVNNPGLNQTCLTCFQSLSEQQKTISDNANQGLYENNNFFYPPVSVCAPETARLEQNSDKKQEEIDVLQEDNKSRQLLVCSLGSVQQALNFNETNCQNLEDQEIFTLQNIAEKRCLSEDCKLEENNFFTEIDVFSCESPFHRSRSYFDCFPSPNQ